MNRNRMIQLDQEINRCYMLLDFEGEALRRSERGAQLALAEDWVPAATDFGRIAEIALQAEEPRHAAQARITQGNLLSHGMQWPAAHLAYTHGAELYIMLQEPLKAAQAYRQVAGYYAWNNQPAEAQATLERALELLKPDGRAEVENGAEKGALIAQIYHSLCQLKWRVGEIQAAGELLTQGIEQFGPLPELVDLQRRQEIIIGLVTGQIGIEAAWEAARPLLSASGWVDENMQGLIDAYQAGKWKKVVTLAAQIRLTTRDLLNDADEDPAQSVEIPLLRYFLASALMAEAQDQQNNRVSALVTLLTCRALLTSHLDEAAGRSIDKVLDNLTDRWGEDGMTAAITGFQTYVAEHGPIEA